MGGPGGAKAGNLEVKVRYSGPAVLPWLWHALEQDGEVVLLPQPIPHIAGPNGARSLCPLPSLTGVPPGYSGTVVLIAVAEHRHGLYVEVVCVLVRVLVT
jgi:hypothetical protein